MTHVNTEARDYEAVLVREEDMDVGLLLFALVDAILEQRAREAERDVLYIQSHDRFAPMGTHRLGQWRAQWWGTR